VDLLLKTSELPEAYRAGGLAEVEEQLKTDNTPTKAKCLALVKGTNITRSLIESASKVH